MDSLGGKNNNYRGKSRFSILECEKGKGGKRMKKEGLWGGYITTHIHTLGVEEEVETEEESVHM